ncbi:MOSC domain-containing protein [Tsukamurella paurometabola]|uniref:MOSC domain-containing protein n=1 Tax=Tsukamurella paurometabola TaxID=2061 RepID=A0ABS5NC08_TSUPA|nr:MOSC domain-containing protein [Tsukamurella paurometabola]MBS4101824.1 MOSC domain-containing protein [Tsukamurella paurometabola]
MTAGRVLAVCVVAEERRLDPRKPDQRTAIDKRPADGPVDVGPLGPLTDHVCDTRHHGGAEQAVYAYSEHEARRWADELGRELPAGWFGENLRLDGDTTDLVVGTRLRVGATLELEVTIPRTPCRTFALWSGEEDWLARFMARGDSGAYFRVVAPGPVAAGDAVVAVHVPEHGATVRDLFRATRPDRLRALLSADDLLPKVERDATRALKRAD